MSNLALEADPVIAAQQIILDRLPIAILITDKKGILHYYNQEAESIFSSEVLLHKKLTQLSEQFTQKDLDNAIDSVNNKAQFAHTINIKQSQILYQLKMIENPYNTILDSNHCRQDYYLLTLNPVPDKSISDVEPLVNPEPSASQEPSASHKPNHISLLKKNFNELKQFSRLSAMREISTSLADKLNQPLTAILSYTQAMQRLYKNNASSEDINDAMQRVVISAENAGEIIRTLRNQLKANNLNYQKACINELIQKSIHLIELDHPTSKIKLTSHYEPEFTSLSIDKIQFKQVIFSLLNNAIDAVLDESVLAPEIEITTAKNETDYKITITDNGPGIPEEIKHKLFEPFTSTKKNGIGIGLSICRHIIDLHKGSIFIHSDENKNGTIVTILLPLTANNLTR